MCVDAYMTFLQISSAFGPIFTFSLIEASKPDNSFLIGGVAVAAICALGQLICAGAAYPIVYIPLYALTRALTLGKTYPRRASGPRTQLVVAAIGTIVGAVSMAAVLVPTASPVWAWGNM